MAEEVQKRLKGSLDYGEQLLVRATDCYDLYDQLARLVFDDEADRKGFHASVRRMLFGVTAHVSKWSLDSMPPLSEFGYKESQKLNQLRKNYWNDEEVNRVKRLVEEDRKRGTRPLTSRTLVLQGVKVKATGQDHCMTSVTFHSGKTAKHNRVDVVYRTTEVAKKFPADLYFLDSLFKEILGDTNKPLLVRFYFVSIYGSTVFYPVFGLIAKEEHELGLDTWFTRRCVIEMKQAIDNVPIKFMQKVRVHKHVRRQIQRSDAVRRRVERILRRAKRKGV